MRKTHAYPVEVLWCGNARAGTRRTSGWSFPAAVRNQIERDCAGGSVLHLFGGLATFGTRLDIDPSTRPDVIADAWLPPFARESFDTVILDPPYVKLNVQEKAALMRAAGWIARRRVIWFHTIWTASGYGLKPERAWLVRVGDTCYVRALQYFQVVARPGPVKRFERGPAMKYNRWLQQPAGLPLLEDAETRERTELMERGDFNA